MVVQYKEVVEYKIAKTKNGNEYLSSPKTLSDEGVQLKNGNIHEEVQYAANAIKGELKNNPNYNPFHMTSEELAATALGGTVLGYLRKSPAFPIVVGSASYVRSQRSFEGSSFDIRPPEEVEIK